MAVALQRRNQIDIPAPGQSHGVRTRVETTTPSLQQWG